MPAELAAHLAGPRATECAATLKRRAYWDYGDGRHYDEAERGRIRACLAEIEAALRSAGGPRADEHREFVADVERQIARDSLDRSLYIPERDRSMAENFRWLAGRLPRGSKIIVWAANGHVVKAVTSDPDYQGRPAMGAWIRRNACADCFTLGFSAASGATRYSARGNETRPVTASAGSVEAAALAGSAASSVYLDGAQLRRLGRLPGSFLGHGEVTEDWSKALDGAVVFREQRPTGRADAPAAANGSR
jgi:erythromycin esterase-like protein